MIGQGAWRSAFVASSVRYGRQESIGFLSQVKSSQVSESRVRDMQSYFCYARGHLSVRAWRRQVKNARKTIDKQLHYQLKY
jgi:hypothetical protein